MDKTEKLVYAMTGFGLLACVFAIIITLAQAVDFALADRVLVGRGTVVQKMYSQSTHSTGIGFGTNGKSSGPVVVSSSTPEKWTIIVKYGDSTFSESVDSNLWGDLSEGAKVDVFEIRGYVFDFGLDIGSSNFTRASHVGQK